MGGFVRAIAKAVFGSPSQPPVVQQVVEAPQATQAVDTTAQTKSKLMGSGYGGSTIMSSAAGVEDEANVGKTVLGGGRKRKIRA
jgi:hypothetical protein